MIRIRRKIKQDKRTCDWCLSPLPARGWRAIYASFDAPVCIAVLCSDACYPQWLEENKRLHAEMPSLWNGRTVQ